MVCLDSAVDGQEQRMSRLVSMATTLRIERPRFALRSLRAPVLVALFGLLGAPALAKNTDVVVMDNGNVIVGEIKLLERGLLEFSVDDITDRLRIKWEHVFRLTSTKRLDFELASGKHYYGSLIESSADGELRIQTPTGVVDVKLVAVVAMEPIKASLAFICSASAAFLKEPAWRI